MPTVELTWGEQGMDHSCDCPLGLNGEFCKHCSHGAGLAESPGEDEGNLTRRDEAAEIPAADGGGQEFVGAATVGLERPGPVGLQAQVARIAVA